LEQRCEARMERSEKSDAGFVRFAVSLAGKGLVATFGTLLRSNN